MFIGFNVVVAQPDGETTPNLYSLAYRKYRWTY